MKSDRNVKCALLTGATGFIGANVARRLVSDGWCVHAIVRPESGLELVRDLLHKITLHVHDGSMNNMMLILQRVKPDIVFHIASLVLPQHQAKDIEPLIESNILFGTQLVEAMIAENVYAMVITGTSWQHFNNQTYSPVCLYAATKQAYEAILTYYTEVTPLKVVNLKLFDTYGPNDPRPKLLSLLRVAAQKQQPLDMTPGEQLLDLVHVDDVVNAYLIAASRLLNGLVNRREDYAVSSGHPIRLQDFVKIFESSAGTTLKMNWGARPYRTREVMVPWKEGKILPGWRPKIGLVEGLRALESNDSPKG